MAAQYLQYPRDDLVAVRPSRALTCYFIIGTGGQQAEDTEFIEMMGMMNIHCLVVDTDSDSALDAEECDFAYISENVSSSAVDTAFASYSKPIILNENGLLDELQWKSTGTVGQGDPTTVDAAGISHRILDLAGISGVSGDAITIYSSPTHVTSWPIANLITGAEHLLLYTADNANSVLSVFPKGLERVDETVQPAVGIWLGPYSTSVNFTDTGRLLFRSIIQFVAEEITKNDLPDYHVVQVAATATAAITGTITTGSPTEADVVAGTAGTIIITLTNDTFKAADTGVIGSTADTTALLNGIDGDVVGGTGWDAEVKANFVAGDIVRNSSTVATVTVGAETGYDISATETITVTVPTDVLVTAAGAIVATPTFTITHVAAGGDFIQSIAGGGGIAGYGGTAGKQGGIAG